MILPFNWPWFGRGGGSSSDAPLVINMIPTEGQTITLPNSTAEIILNLDPAADLDMLNLELPDNSAPREGQRVFVSSTRAVLQLTATGPDIVNGGVVMYSPGDNYVWLQNKEQIWSRVKS